jgi:signal transduction histidine kinase
MSSKEPLEKVSRLGHYTIVLNSSGRLVDFTPVSTLAHNLGISLRSSAIYQTLDELLDSWKVINPHDLRMLRESLKDVLNSNSVEKETFLEYHIDLDLPKPLHLHFSSQKLYGHIVLTVRDETELTHLKRELETQLELYRRNIGEIAHEFGHSLTVIGGFAQNLRKYLPPDKQEIADIMVKEVRNLEESIKKYLDHYKIESGKMGITRNEVSLYKDVIAPVLTSLSYLIVQKRATIDFDHSLTELQIFTDPFWLKIVYRNLFQNALNYGGERTRITFGAEDQGSHYLNNVWNSGSGIKEEDMPVLFTLFGRLPDDNQEQGTGIGLYNSARIVEALGGEMWPPESDGRTFTNFRFTHPK